MTTTAVLEQDTKTAVGTTEWKLDASHSHAHFKVRHLMISNVTGEFTKLSGEFRWNPNDLALNYVEANFETASVTTGEEGRDAHLKGADFFNSEAYPNMAFRSTKFEQKGEGELLVTGDLTIRDVTKSVQLKVEGPTDEIKDPWGNQRIGLQATTKVNRKDFGLTWNVPLEGSGVLVGDDVKITIEAEFIKG